MSTATSKLLWSLLFTLMLANPVNADVLPKVEKAFLAADFLLSSESGKPYRLSEYRGKVVVLNFWATWCPPCREEMPSMERAWQKLKNHQVMFLAVNVGEDADTIFEFTGEYPVSFPLLMDQASDVIRQYPVMGLPTTFIISPDGMVHHRVIGAREWDSEEILAALKKLTEKNK